MRHLLFILAVLALPAWAAQKKEPRVEQVTGLKKMTALQAVKRIVFAVRGLKKNDLHFYENYGQSSSGGWSHDVNGFGRLCILDIATGKVKTILEDPKGAVRDPCVSYDAKRILFSYRKGGTHNFHLYEIDVDGSGLRQITKGPWDDVEPCYLPDDDIVFVSSRARRKVPCWSTDVGLLHRVRRDGTGMRMLSNGIEHECTPWILPDGRVTYMRWEYTDRNEIDFHHLWAIAPDGTRQMALYGNSRRKYLGMRGGVYMIDPKPMPDSEKLVAVFGGHNSPQHAGDVVLIDTSKGPDAGDEVLTKISKGYVPGVKQVRNVGHRWRDPWPLSENCFLVCALKTIYIMNGDGQVEPLYELKEGNQRVWVHEPRPLLPRKREPIVPSVIAGQEKAATMLMADVRIGRRTDKLEKNQVARILILEDLPKPVSYDVPQDAVSLCTSYNLRRIIGTVPVESDGSAHFTIPANRPVFFVLQDAEGRHLKRMQSFVYGQPGEITGCVGCHEHRTRTPNEMLTSSLQAFQRPPSTIEPVKDVPEVFDFIRDIQPIFDRHCLPCHSAEKNAGKLCLEANRLPQFTRSYFDLFYNKLIDFPTASSKGNAPAKLSGAANSKLYQVLMKGHHNVKLAPGELKRLQYWIDIGATFAGHYGAMGLRYRTARVRLDKKAIKERCDDCHHGRLTGPHWGAGLARANAIAWYRNIDLTKPEMSLILRAPLSKSAGGLGLCKKAKHRSKKAETAPPVEVFTSTDDPLYKDTLNRIRKAAKTLKPAYYQDGYRPPRGYFDQMIRMGVLKGKPEKPDFYAIDQHYFNTVQSGPGVK